MSKWIYKLVIGISLSLSPLLFADDHPFFKPYSDQGEILDGSRGTLKSIMPGKLSISVVTRNFTNSDLEKLNKAIFILEKVMNSDYLKNLILTFQYKGMSQFHQNNGLMNFEVLNLIMSGAESLNPIKDTTMNFDLTMYRSFNPFSKVKGYTKPDTNRIWINSKYYRKSSWTAADVAGNLAHEWLHKLGFTHDYYHNEDRRFSVPYAIGYLVRDMAKTMN